MQGRGSRKRWKDCVGADMSEIEKDNKQIGGMYMRKCFGPKPELHQLLIFIF